MWLRSCFWPRVNSSNSELSRARNDNENSTPEVGQTITFDDNHDNHNNIVTMGNPYITMRIRDSYRPTFVDRTYLTVTPSRRFNPFTSSSIIPFEFLARSENTPPSLPRFVRSMHHITPPPHLSNMSVARIEYPVEHRQLLFLANVLGRRDERTNVEHIRNDPQHPYWWNHLIEGAAQTEIDRLPTETLSSKTNNLTNDRCTICLSNFVDGDKVRTLPCFHVFHKECIDEWLQRNQTCPICKAPI